MAKYALLIQGIDAEWESMTPAQWEVHGAAHERFREAAGERKISGMQLEAATTATTLRSDGDGGVLVTDGPFLETKEVLGGLYLVEARDLDEVVELVKLLPEVRAGHSGVEIRPLVEH